MWYYHSIKLPEVSVMENKFDLIVAGGGFGGVASAISAARRGVKVLLRCIIAIIYYQKIIIFK